jgi:hypothetical protein
MMLDRGIASVGTRTASDAAPNRAVMLAARLAWPATAAAMVAALMAPALWNGFPLIFSDTGGYLERPFLHTLELGRSALYGTFLAAGIPLDFWPNLAVQAGLTAWIVTLMLRAHLGRVRPLIALAVVLILVALTSLPWSVSELMPDIFVPLAALALHLLAFRRDALGRAERLGLVALIGFAIASHMSILALALALALGFAALRLLAARLALPQPRLALALLAVTAGIGLSLSSNAIIAGRLAFTPGGVTFLFARLLKDGIVTRYLDRVCPDPTLRICAFRNDLPANADDWVWSPDSPLRQLGGWQGFEPEAWRIVIGTLRSDPTAHIESAIRDTSLQLVTVGTGGALNLEDKWHARWALSLYAPDTTARIEAARQQRGGIDFTAINRLQVPIALAATALLPALIVGLRRRRPAIAALALSTLAALLANAAICGLFSLVHDRYQSRLAPIAVLAVLIALLARRGQPDRPDGAPTSSKM